MAVNYDRFIEIARRLISENGREVLFLKENGSDNPQDSDRPWRGSNPSTDPDGVTLSIISVPPNQVRQFGLSALGMGVEFDQMIARSENLLICFPDGNDLRQFTHVLDVVKHSITGLQILKPGPSVILAYVGVRR